MAKSALTVIHGENKITLKKKADVAECIIFATVFVAGVLLPIFF